MKKYLSPLIKNSFKTIFKSYILSKKVYVDIEYINLKILKNCSLGQKNESIILPIDNIILPSILKTGAWESHIIKLVKKYSKKRMFIFLDIGANIGLISRQVDNSKKIILNWKNKLPIIYKSDTQGMDEEIILSLKETFLKNIEILIIEISNNKAILKNINKFNKIIKFFSKFYIHNQRVSKKNVLNKIKSRNEFDLIMVK